MYVHNYVTNMLQLCMYACDQQVINMWQTDPKMNMNVIHDLSLHGEKEGEHAVNIIAHC